MEKIVSKMKEILIPTEEKSREAYQLADVFAKLSKGDNNEKIHHFIFYEIALLSIQMRELIEILEDMK